MRRLISAGLGLLGVLALLSLAMVSVSAAGSVSPWTYSHGADSGEGVFGNPPVTSLCTAAGLTLIKTGETSDDSSAGAKIGGFNGSVITELGFDVLAGSHFSGGAPRFNVRTGEGSENIHFYGAAAATAVDGAPAGYQRYTFDLTKDGAGNGGTGDKQITSINVVFDEQGEATIKNIDVNDTILNCVVAAVSTPTPSTAASGTAHPSAVPSTSVLAVAGGGPIDHSMPWTVGLLLFGIAILGSGVYLLRRR